MIELDQEGPQVAGRSVPRRDAVDKATGRAQYAIDLTLPRCLHGVCVRSDVPHGRIRSIDPSRALAIEGVIAVIKGEDLLSNGWFPRYGHAVVDHPVLAIEKVRFVGEPVALVVAEHRWQAERAAREVDVDIEALPASIFPEEAADPAAPLIHEEDYSTSEDKVVEEEDVDGADSRNVFHIAGHEWGDVDRAFDDSDVVVEGTFRYPKTYGYAMEPYNALAWARADSVTVWSPAQHPYAVRSELCRILGWPMARVRVSAPYIGGGYGTKSYTKVEPLAVIASILCRKPVKVALTIDESIMTTRADSAVVYGRTGFSNDGRILAREFDILIDAGAYADSSPWVTDKAAMRCSGPYRIPNLRVRARAVYTNTIPASSLRGFGGPQGVFASESLMDMGAEELGMDPLELRRLNLAERGERIFAGRRGLDSDLHSDVELIEKSRAELGASAEQGDEERSFVGRGFALAATDPGDLTPISTVLVRIHADGSVSLMSGATEMGQGSQTVLSQIVANELGVELDRVVVLLGDTGVGSFERTTGASRTTTVVGRALQAACTDARERVRRLADQCWADEIDTIEDAPGGVRVNGKHRSYGEVIQAWFGTLGGEVVGYGATRREGDFTELPVFWEVGVVDVGVRVDPETFLTSVTDLTTVGDCGFAINPRMVRAQEEGAALGGMGAALTEEMVYEGGDPLNATIVDYRVPRFTDWPSRVMTYLAQRRDGAGPYGARGSGESAVHPMGAAMAAAIKQATGVRAMELPITPERLWRLKQATDRQNET